MTINAGYVINVLMCVGSAWLRLIRYVAKIAAVEYQKYTVLSTPAGSFWYTSLRPDRNWNALCIQTKYSQYGKNGYRNTGFNQEQRRGVDLG